MFLRWMHPATHPVPLILYRSLCVFLLTLPAHKKAFAYQDIALGLAAVEEGDDRQRPALQLYSSLGKDGYVTGTYYGRKFAQVEEKTYLVNLGVRSSLFNSNQFYACVGGSALLEQTLVKPFGTDLHKDDDNAYNFGVTFGVQYEQAWQGFFFRGAWESSLYLAGEAGILLATARKQAVSITAGTRL